MSPSVRVDAQIVEGPREKPSNNFGRREAWVTYGASLSCPTIPTGHGQFAIELGKILMGHFVFGRGQLAQPQVLLLPGDQVVQLRPSGACDLSRGCLVSRNATKLGDGNRLIVPVAVYISAKGKQTEGNGIVPDDAFPWSYQVAVVGSDNQLEAAIRSRE